MGKYVDGYVIPIKKAKVKAYKKLATLGRRIWMEHGALEYYECVGDALDSEWGLPFKKLCKLKSGETLIFAFVVYKSKADRNRINAKVHKDPRMQPKPGKEFVMPFDMKRFSMGGFKTLIST
jgi:alkaline phosphatase